MADILERIQDCIISYKPDAMQEVCREALDDGISPKDIIQKGLLVGMEVVGAKFKDNEIFVPEVLIATKAMHVGLELVKPLVAKTDIEPIGIVVLGTVKGDLHDIGKNLVGMMLEGAGFEVIDVGIDVPPEKFIAAVDEHKADILAMSTLLTSTLQRLDDTIEAVKEKGVREQIKIMVGGAPVTQGYADKIGADGYAKDASSATDKAKELLGWS